MVKGKRSHKVITDWLMSSNSRFADKGVWFDQRSVQNSMVDSTEQVLLVQCILHQIYQRIAQRFEIMIDMLEIGQMYPPFELRVDARAVYDAISAPNVCEPVGCSLQLYLISVRDKMSHDLVPRFHRVGARDMLADGLTKGRG